MPAPNSPLQPWMKLVLRLAGVWNLLAAVGMIVFHHEGYRMLGLPKPAIILPVQVMGILVGLFGVGYLLVAHSPIENRNILTLGFCSKAIASAFAAWYIVVGKLPWTFAPLLIVGDIIWLPPFWAILRRLYKRM